MHLQKQNTYLTKQIQQIPANEQLIEMPLDIVHISKLIGNRSAKKKGPTVAKTKIS